MFAIDTGPLYAIYDSKDRYHSKVKDFIETSRSTILVSPYVLAELDYLVLNRLGLKVELAMLNDISGGAFVLESLGTEDVKSCLRILEKMNNQTIGLTDASVAYIAMRNNTNTIMTLDYKHFAPLRNGKNKPFELVPEKIL